MFEFTGHEREPRDACAAPCWSGVGERLSDVTDGVSGGRCRTSLRVKAVPDAAIASSALRHVGQAAGAATYQVRGRQWRHLAELLGELFRLQSEFAEVTCIESSVTRSLNRSSTGRHDLQSRQFKATSWSTNYLSNLSTDPDQIFSSC